MLIIIDSASKCTKPNEVFDECPKTCPPRICGVDERTIRCAAPPKPGDPACKPGCRCADNYYRNEQGTCVTKKQCKIQCNKNEVFDLCPAPCPPRRCGIDPATVNCIPSPKIGDPGCEPGCRCIDGYVRNDTDACIPKEECQCGENERYEVCPFATCTAKNCSEFGLPISCPGQTPDGSCPGGSGCVCINGYLRNDIGACIPQSECEACGGDPNARAGCGSNCNRKCSDIVANETKACTLACRVNACDCKDGYYLDENTGKCVLPNECQSCNKPNEVYERCTFDCPPQTCDSLDKAYACPLQNNQTCVGKCKCKPGYYRNLIGECISEEDCRRCPGKHEYYSCGGACDNICDKLSEENQTSCSIINIKCNEMCYCEEGYARNKNNICVPFDQCNDPVCPENERYDKCPAFLCGPQKCSELGFGTNCPASVNNGTCPGKPGCVCDNGYVRNNKNVCIPQDQCPSCGGDENAQPGCGNYCGNRCSDYEGGPKICPLICILNSCDCRPGYVYDDLVKKCVLPKDCSSKPLCGENEESSDCANRYDSSDCYVDPKDCIQGCICKVGYVRNDEGICVRDDCDDSCNGDPNAVVGCGVNCNRHCSDIGKECQSCAAVCYEDGCDCKDGYYYDDNINKCVLPEDCTKTCGRNEVYSNCTQAQCGPKNCSQLGYPVACPMIQASSCTQGCLCKKGYLRAENGTCIPGEKCPSCGGDNNARSGCGVNCNKRCGDIGKEPGACIAICYDNACDCKEGFYLNENTGKCVKPNQCPKPLCGENEESSDCANCYDSPDCNVDPMDCIQGCICKVGYVRKDEGVCVRDDCDDSCNGDPNAVVGCGVNCNRHCSNIGKEIQSCAAVCYEDGCDCKDGYYYDDNINKCVLPEDCTRTCGKDEVYNDCIQGYCQPKNCSQIGKPVACPRIDPKNCIKGCLCKENYVRADNGTCIPKTDCPSCGGDNNARSGCGVNCNKRCSDIGKEPGACILICYDNACDCKDGFYLNENTGKCVKPNQCPPTCGKDEVYNDCIQGYCQPKNCSEIGKPVACPRIDPKKCIKGCLCKENYVRADNGTCIPKTDCPSCGEDNNARSGCGVNCNKRCSDIGKEPGACILICYDNACDCKDGFYLNENTGKCVKPNQCPRTCSKDEVYSECIEGQCQPKTCFDVGKPVTCPRIDPKKCTKGCLCKEDYVRVNNGTCIPKTECPSCGGDCNARAGCGVYCNRRCSDRGQEPKACTEICYDNACDCKPGFYLNEITGKCVPPNKCPPSCGRNEVYNSCVQGQCRPKSCSQLGKPLSCPRIDPKYCKGGCLCEDGYVKAKNGTCIPEKECPSCGGDPNAEAGCGINCNRRCSDVGKDPGVCEDDICAVNGCDCKQGYYYDYVSSKCVLPDRCPTTNSSGNVDQSLEKLRRGNMALVGQFLWELYKMNPGQSFVTSPVSVLIPYGQLALYAVGETLDQLLKFINLDNKDQIKEAFPALLKNYRSQTSILLTVAVKCYGNINYPFTDQFKNDAVTYFDSEGENIDFKYAKQAADTINGWVANKTNNLIQNVVSEDLFSGDTRLVLVDAFYMRGNWQNQFNPNNTHDRDFYITPNKTKSIKTMYQENFFNYGENEILDAQILELFYKGGNSSLVILLPKKKDGLPQMSHKLRNSDEFFNSIKSLRREKVKCFLPKMDIETKMDIADLSQKMNVTKMFDPQSNDFEGMLVNSDPVHISAAIQKNKIIVDETGTEAAVATAVVGARTTSAIIPKNEYYFIADRSYVFCVLLERDPLFCGVFNGN
ncbi:zonadhesin-like isoform X6 [Bombyx mandarina]|uniref:Zonadhesin-like isoform X6 n=1 Tax=Bombyx mandarina TaxID=7092 RepID=A0A6J2KN50_BOMMA|nr:zonadhesin-like isoform X6 [Bombyx mandarina]